MIAVNAAGWWGPLGWLYRNTPGNLVAGFIQVAIAAVVVTLLWPPLRRRVHAFVDRKLAPIHDHLTAIRAHHETQAASFAELHRKLDALATPPPPEHIEAVATKAAP